MFKDPREQIKFRNPRLKVMAYAAVAFFMLSRATGVFAFEIDVEQLATAIYYAENSKSHPYGVLVHFKHTSPRQVCINTIRHALRDWNCNGDFIEFLGSRYCPIGAKNDPKGLNKNWVKNVKHFLKKEINHALPNNNLR